MKKALIPLIFIIFISLSTKGQNNIPKMELKQNGFVGVGLDSTKNFVVLDIPNKKKNDLYKTTLIYLNSVYNNPQKVLSTVENEVIVINGLTNSIKDFDGLYEYRMTYNINIQFKDEKLKFEPTVTELIEIFSSINKESRIYIANTDSPKDIELDCIWMKSKKANDYFILRDKLKLSLENWINNYMENLMIGITKNDW